MQAAHRALDLPVCKLKQEQKRKIMRTEIEKLSGGKKGGTVYICVCRADKEATAGSCPSASELTLITTSTGKKALKDIPCYWDSGTAWLDPSCIQVGIEANLNLNTELLQQCMYQELANPAVSCIPEGGGQAQWVADEGQGPELICQVLVLHSIKHL